MLTRRKFLAANGLALAATGLGGASLINASGIATAAPGKRGRGVTWTPGRLLPTFGTPGHLHAATVEDLHGDDQLLLTTLQGLVNRSKPELYFNYDAEPGNPDQAWLDGFDADRVTVHEDPLSLIDKYKRVASGAIIFDPEVPDSVNVATTLAGLRDAVVASAEQVETHGLKIIEDLRGRFTGQSKVQIYRWLYDELWPQCEQRLISGLPPTRVVDVDGVTWREVARETEQIRDSSNRQELTIDVSAELGGEAVYVKFGDAFGNDGWGASVASLTATADGTVIADFAAGSDEEAEFLVEGGNSSIGGDQNRFADGGNFFIYRFEPPEGTTSLTVTVDIWNQFLISATDTAPTRVEPFPYFRDYVVATKAMVVWLDPNGEPGELLAEIMAGTERTTPYMGWFSNDVAGEWGGVDLAATQEVEVVPADFYMNGTVHGGVPAHISTKIRKPAKVPLENKIYVTMTVGEGDNIQYCQRHMRALWDNPDRGRAPTNWTISPLLADAGPAIYRYYQQTATENDLLVCGPSGAGYTYGGSWPGDSFNDYADVSQTYLKATGLDLVYAYNNRDENGWIPIGGAVLDAYRERTQLKGIFQSWDGGGVITGGELPVVGHFGAPGNATEYKAGIDTYVEQWDGNAPFFISAGINAWNWNPTDISNLYELLLADDRFEVVLGDTFFNLIRMVDDPQPPPPSAAARRAAARRAGRTATARARR